MMNIIIASIGFLLLDSTFCLKPVPNLPDEVYQEKGDLDLGGLFSVHKYSSNSLCGTEIYSTTRFQHIQAMVYSVQKINSMNSILPNITLGYTILDDCVKPSTALARALHFFPNEQTQQLNSSAPFFDVVGVVGPFPSSNSILVAQALLLFQIPQISPLSTSAELSNKDKYPYFLRVVPPDQYQARVITDIIHNFGWKYISALNSEGSYGSTGISQVKKRAAELGICIAYSMEIRTGTSRSDFDMMVRALDLNKKARVVVMFVGLDAGIGILKAARRAGKLGQFIWIFSDTFGNNKGYKNIEDIASGAFFVKIYSKVVPDFVNYYENLNPWNSKSPWYNQLWSTVFNCTWSGIRERKNCSDYTSITNSSTYNPEPTASFVIDAVFTFGNALHRLFETECPEAFRNKTLARTCVKGSNLLGYLRRTTFNGSAGEVSFDEHGDAQGTYTISQLQKWNGSYTVRQVGTWDLKTMELYLENSSTQWSFIRQGADSEMFIDTPPHSVCSTPCQFNQQKIQKELPCCWECRPCRSNEIVINNGTDCIACPTFNWPNQSSFSNCLTIPPSFVQWTDGLAITLQLVSVIGIFFCFFVIGVMINYKNHRLIRSFSRELSSIILVGLLLSFGTVSAFLSAPNTVSCIISRCGFNISYSLVYAPLLAKSSRIYRIFESGRKGIQRPKFISTSSQLFLTAVLLLIQAMITAATLIIAPPHQELRMPVPTEEYVELLCPVPIEGLLIPIVYNLMLIICCAVYGFKTRKLPDNFNESWFIFLSVCSTIFLWLAFIPTYFAAYHAYHKTVVLAFSLIVNSFVILLCLFAPKLYALFYVSEDNIKYAETNMTGGTSVNQVHPSKPTINTVSM